MHTYILVHVYMEITYFTVCFLHVCTHMQFVNIHYLIIVPHAVLVVSTYVCSLHNAEHIPLVFYTCTLLHVHVYDCVVHTCISRFSMCLYPSAGYCYSVLPSLPLLFLTLVTVLHILDLSSLSSPVTASVFPFPLFRC